MRTASLRRCGWCVAALMLSLSSCDLEPIELQFHPNPPSISLNMSSEDSVIVTWTDNSILEDGYLVQWRTGNEEEFMTAGQTGPNATRFVHRQAVVPNVFYEYRVGTKKETAVRFSGSIKTYLSFFGPAQLNVTGVSATSLRLSWYYVQQFEDGFRIERKQLPGGAYAVVGEEARTARTFTDVNVDPTKQYRYRVYAYTSKNMSYADSIQVHFGGASWAELP
ncbi:MAG: fibronectin type III domain-containing protein [Bacteroidetes bacterium]|nr:MAG: fibronectin type III domain-containing protein [Bacteroidota bacterium]